MLSNLLKTIKQFWSKKPVPEEYYTILERKIPDYSEFSRLEGQYATLHQKCNSLITENQQLLLMFRALDARLDKLNEKFSTPI